MKNNQIETLEKRIEALERAILKPSSSKLKGQKKESELTHELDSLMQEQSKLHPGGIVFTGLAIPSENPNRLVRWSCSGGFKKLKDINEFISHASDDDISRFCSNFSSPEKMKIIRILIKEGPLAQKEILKKTDLSQGQFYHHVKDMISNKLLEKSKKDSYDLSPIGHVLSVSFISLINTFLK